METRMGEGEEGCLERVVEGGKTEPSTLDHS